MSAAKGTMTIPHPVARFEPVLRGFGGIKVSLRKDTAMSHTFQRYLCNLTPGRGEYSDFSVTQSLN